MNAQGRFWDATPITETHTLRLTVSRANFWPVTAGFLAGVLVAMVAFASAQSEIDQRSIETGVFTYGGRAFKLVEMKP